MKRTPIILCLLLIALLTISCSNQAIVEGQPAQPQQQTQPSQLTCQEYCEQQPHIMCVGDWEISGAYPDCSCSFACEGQDNAMEIKPVEEEKTNATKLGASKTLPNNMINVPRVYSGARMKINRSGKIVEEEQPSLCYLGAYAMLAIYDDPSLNFYDIVAYSGAGVKLSNNPFSGLDNGLKENSIMTASENLGYDYALGLLAGGTDTSMPHEYRFSDNAREKKDFIDQDAALYYLKSTIDSGRPVLVHLDAYFVRDDFAEFSPFWESSWQKIHASHFMVVTGYDEKYVYLSDPTDPDISRKNMPAQMENFLKAWANGNHPSIIGSRVGPYWMIHITNNGNRKSLSEIIDWNRKEAMDASVMISKARTYSMIGELAVGRLELSKFLRKNGYVGAADAYRELADFYFTEPDLTILKKNAYKEDEARNLLG